MKKQQRRTRGAGSLERRNGYYMARWMVNGKRFSQAIKTTDRKAAEKRLAEITAPFRLSSDADRLAFFAGKIQKANDEIKRIREAAPGLLIKDAWNAYELSPERPQKSDNALNEAFLRWSFFESFIAERYPDIKELRHITREHTAAFMIHFAKKHSNITYNRERSFLESIWNFFLDYPGAKLTGGNPFSKIAKQIVRSISRRALTADELRRVCAYVQGDYRLLFAIGIYTGLRFSDAVFLKWENIDMTRRMIICTPRKTANYNRVVNIPIHATLYKMFCEFSEIERRGYVLPGLIREYKGKLIRKIKIIFKECGIQTERESPDNGRRRCVVGFHSLRHSFVSMAANSGAPLAVVQSIVGHSTARMTAHYFHETENALNAAVALLPNVIDGKGGGMDKSPFSVAYSEFEKAACRLAPDEIERAIKCLRRIQNKAAIDV